MEFPNVVLVKFLDVSNSIFAETIKNKTNIRYKKKRAPKRTAVQKAAIRPKCRKLVVIFRKKAIIMDDESYFGLSNTELSGNAGFYTSDPNLTKDEVKSKRKSKFEKKLLVWVAFSEKGLSSHYIVPSGQAVDADVYTAKCLPRLVSFIQKYHKNDQVVFWPDLASSHYSKKALEYLSDKNIEVVPKCYNPANCSELRPIEDFWGESKRIVYDKCWVAENLKQLRNRREYAFTKVSPERV